jgi:hypothetical protein
MLKVVLRLSTEGDQGLSKNLDVVHVGEFRTTGFGGSSTNKQKRFGMNFLGKEMFVRSASRYLV